MNENLKILFEQNNGYLKASQLPDKPTYNLLLRLVAQGIVERVKAGVYHYSSEAFDETMIDIVHHPMYKPENVELPVFDKWIPRDYQLPIIEYCVDYKPPAAKFVALQTGKGKTFISLMAA